MKLSVKVNMNWLLLSVSYNRPNYDWFKGIEAWKKSFHNTKQSQEVNRLNIVYSQEATLQKRNRTGFK